MSEEMKHTPGPWRYEIGRVTPHATAFGFGVFPVKGRDGLPDGISQRALTSGNLYEHGNFEFFYGPEEIEANARLIAAAPDLYDALRNMMGAFDNPVRRVNFASDFADEAINTARAAIAKAEGRRCPSPSTSADSKSTACRIDRRS